MKPPRIGLCMIVKDEERVIERALLSLINHIHSWCIVDTGSDDATPALVEQALQGIPGQLHHRPWINFGHNRSEALELGRAFCDYQLVVDADDWLQFPAEFAWSCLEDDAYSLLVHYGATTYPRVQLLSTRLPWRYQGVLHEYPECDLPYQTGHLAAPTLHIGGGEGARSRNPDKYREDAALLLQVHLAEPEDLRTLFYLAQSYRDAGMMIEAIEFYGKRAAAGGWAEEAAVAAWQQGLLLQQSGAPDAEVEHALLQSYALQPLRPEALTDLARFWRERERWPLAYMMASRAAALAPRSETLFADTSYAEWRARDELSLAAYWVGNHAESEALSLQLLECGPTEHHERWLANLELVRAASS